MKFKLGLIDTPGSERVTLDVKSEFPRCFGDLFTIIDTGSARTIISAKDVYFLKLPFKNGEESTSIKGFGKGGIPCRILKKFKFYLKSEDGKIKHIEMPVCVVDLGALNKMNKDFVENAYRVPSIIGLDFLRSQKMKLIVDFENGSSSLEEI